jgi:hypothetical protein
MNGRAGVVLLAELVRIIAFAIRYGIGWLLVWISGASARLAVKVIPTVP